ncbi:MAG: DUF1294 domain-containing protein [Rhizobiaceae bacterium]
MALHLVCHDQSVGSVFSLLLQAASRFDVKLIALKEPVMNETLMRLSSVGLANSVFIWLIIINLAGFAAMFADKRRAEAGISRIPEGRLLLLALLGGSLGALSAQQLFRHKTRKQPFRSRLFAIGVLQVSAAIIALTPSFRQIAFQLMAPMLK